MANSSDQKGFRVNPLEEESVFFYSDTWSSSSSHVMKYAQYRPGKQHFLYLQLMDTVSLMGESYFFCRKLPATARF